MPYKAHCLPPCLPSPFPVAEESHPQNSRRNAEAECSAQEGPSSSSAPTQTPLSFCESLHPPLPPPFPFFHCAPTQSHSFFCNESRPARNPPPERPEQAPSPQLPTRPPMESPAPRPAWKPPQLPIHASAPPSHSFQANPLPAKFWAYPPEQAAGPNAG